MCLPESRQWLDNTAVNHAFISAPWVIIPVIGHWQDCLKLENSVKRRCRNVVSSQTEVQYVCWKDILNSFYLHFLFRNNNIYVSTPTQWLRHSPSNTRFIKKFKIKIQQLYMLICCKPVMHNTAVHASSFLCLDISFHITRMNKDLWLHTVRIATSSRLVVRGDNCV